MLYNYYVLLLLGIVALLFFPSSLWLGMENAAVIYSLRTTLFCTDDIQITNRASSFTSLPALSFVVAKDTHRGKDAVIKNT